MWENKVITESGVGIVAGLLDGGTIKVSSVKSGAGNVDAESLTTQTEMADIKQTGTIQKIEKINDYIEITVLFTNQGLAASYGMKQVGIFVMDGDKEILFAIIQTEEAKEIPSESITPMYSLVQKFRFHFKNDIDMVPVIDPEGLCSMELYLELVARLNAIENAVSDCVAIADE